MHRAVFLLAFAACDPRYWVCDEADVARLAQLPARLSETGLDGPNVRAYTPRFALWSDGATKRRWLAVPAGAQIDTADPDDWVFPDGTRAWKEFAIDGVPIETRLIAKIGPGDDAWVDVAYVWLADGSDAVATPEGVFDARGTPHDVPAAGECVACHGGRRSHLLGISAIQLAQDPQVLEGITPTPVAIADIPGDATTRAALGYVHANCSHCHNQRRPERGGARCFDPDNALDFELRAAELATPESTATYRTVVGEQIRRGDPDGSRVVDLMSGRGMFRQMPPLATEQVDTEGLATVRAWIKAL